ncbi:multimeric flavodoxin WrbA [Clostridium tetanomorphum]|uniref:NAD(P)H-dependent oxidoreductase n=1 Tax=Clostridium tetanomorphum TaxID=1553 RepID=UPI000445A916|nr:NAD(P)H-dependent oxidoreductase [Clostridium tetanomorphum]KAJ51676.1 NAD(P)H dehydrogenase (quinone) [Clostridium tetanomorphum DSM 665]KAJ51956.1 NAD(P)H dehydrogenase (quinone) [Clostridium tetanomorphum DSM 665]MBP1864034.1 multimeric flavodoxin WrbA [Clostridium tetanomorphum]NRS84447.1 multimeric flavodoxin WrbA [Clostridium tetanomorphum]SQB92058.1 iron-sulfur flavoprotein [Clostridium tetanomorphum]
MKIVVLNGSPKGDISVTMQYINYIQKKFKHHQLKIINISQGINKIEKDKKTFEDIINEIKLSDGVIWAFPLYVFTVHSNYQRFIELIFERNVEDAFKGKYASVVTTSIHFYDHTAINYMNSICDDLNMNYVDYFSAEMYDLKKEHIRKNLLQFAQNYFDAIENKVITLKNYSPVEYSLKEYIPEIIHDKIDVSNKKIIIVTDSLENINLKNMIDKFINSFSQTIELINLQYIDIKGSCLGCLKCGYNYECAYTGKDDFINFYNSKLKTADIIVFAGSIKYRHLSSTWKKFLDRGFFNTHTPSLSGKQIGFIISGVLRQIPNLRQILESYVQWQGSNLVGFVTDEYDTNIEIDEQLYTFSYNLIKLSTVNYTKPATFLGIAGMKIFRDEVWGNLRFPFVADHKAYKTLNVYDFPQKNYKSRIMNFIFILMCKFPFIRKEIYSNQIKSSMIVSLKKIVENTST